MYRKSKATRLVDDLVGGEVSRREFHRALAATGIGLAGTTLPLSGASANTDPAALSVFEWAGYELPEFYPGYLDKHGAPPAFTLFAEEEEALQKLRSGFPTDISHPCSGSVARWRDAGTLRPLDVGRIEAWDDVFQTTKDIRGVKIEGEYYFLPWDWGNSSILYRPDLLPLGEDEQSYGVLLRPELKGKIAMNDSVDSSFAVGGLLTGAENIFEMTDEEIDDATEVVRALHQNVRFYWSSPTEFEQAMAAGEVVAAWSWNSSIIEMKNQDIEVVFMNPKEGIMTWICGFTVMSSGVSSDDLIYDYLNAAMEPRVGKYLIEAYGYGHSNEKTYDLVPQDVLESLGIVDPVALMAQGNFYDEIPADIREKMIVKFDEVKAGF
ncbi:MAG: extracellular solute-binding protein [Alphaproteobacteria bacterium]|nr:extracellular solute-binding protein [Alphaproteobacteria bacterium]